MKHSHKRATLTITVIAFTGDHTPMANSTNQSDSRDGTERDPPGTHLEEGVQRTVVWH